MDDLGDEIKYNLEISVQGELETEADGMPVVIESPQYVLEKHSGVYATKELTEAKEKIREVILKKAKELKNESV